MIKMNYDKTLRFVLYKLNYHHRIGYSCLNFKDAFQMGLRKFGKGNFYIELQADYCEENWCELTNIKTISKVTDFKKMEELSNDSDFNPYPDIYKTNENYVRFLNYA